MFMILLHTLQAEDVNHSTDICYRSLNFLVLDSWNKKCLTWKLSVWLIFCHQIKSVNWCVKSAAVWWSRDVAHQLRRSLQVSITRWDRLSSWDEHQPAAGGNEKQLFNKEKTKFYCSRSVSSVYFIKRMIWSSSLNDMIYVLKTLLERYSSEFKCLKRSKCHFF